ncbi:MAG TPA: DUF2804 domain-containing protein [Anaerolineaceae bacterium]
MEHELINPSSLLDADGRLAQVGWSRQPLVDCNLEQAAFYPRALRGLQRLRVKRWDYYALFTPQRFVSATIADLGYAANIFAYTLDFASGELHEQTLVTPAWTARLPRNSDQGESIYEGKAALLRFQAGDGFRKVLVDWPGFDCGPERGRGLRADLQLACPPGHESMNIIIPIRGKRFYWNRKINAMPAEGLLHLGALREEIFPHQSAASLDWGRGVWEYRSYWNWASASGYLPDGRGVGLNLGRGFGDTSAASENALVLDGKLHKLGAVTFDYTPGDYLKPWHFRDADDRLDLTLTPFKERVAQSNMLVIFSEVHQMFGRYAGRVTTDTGEILQIDGLTGFAEEHHARW